MFIYVIFAQLIHSLFIYNEHLNLLLDHNLLLEYKIFVVLLVNIWYLITKFHHMEKC